MPMIHNKGRQMNGYKKIIATRRKKMNVIARFEPEIALDPLLKTYSGGLGVLAGSVARTAKRMNAPLVSVTILWNRGFYEQSIGPHGMEISYPCYDYYKEGIVEDTGIKVKVQIGENPNVLIKVGLIKPEVFNTVPIITLDSNIPENDDLSRRNTWVLYPNDTGQRLAQEIILGIGGVRALQALKVPVDVYHLNESYTVLAGIELLNQRISQGESFIEALERTKQQIVFTTHTPEITHEAYNIDLMRWMGCFPNLNKHEIAYLGGDPFNHTVAALRLARKGNAVSKLHAQTVEETLAWVKNKCPIVGITNGMDAEYWQWIEFKNARTPEEAEKAKLHYKMMLLKYIETQTSKVLKEDVFTVVWARRFAEYKRPWLLYYDNDWFERLLESKEIQIIYAGKPHPADIGMINVWNNIWKKSKEWQNLVILPGYNLQLSKLLKGGTDLWLNTPRRPREACGTSWISAMMNCSLVMSTRDGGAIEAIDQDNGFLFGVNSPCLNENEQDSKDFADLKQSLLLAMDIFYKAKEKWYQMALAAKKRVIEDFSTEKMLKEYCLFLYK
ncbi:MAG: alpha-glucan family phosphorylase [Minisyncoccales bacterium]